MMFMTHASPSLALNGSRLVRLLSELELAKAPLSHRQFIERLGRCVSITDSITLAQALGRRVETPAQDADACGHDAQSACEAIQRLFVQAHAAMIERIAQTFVVSGEGRIRLPPLPQTPAKLTWEPYHRFYAAHQRELESQIQRLHLQVRDQVTALTPALAQLALLDQVFGQRVAARLKKYFAVTPRLLEKRFDQLQAQAMGGADAPADYRWVEAFCLEMQQVLLAELEARLLPLLGLVEAAMPAAAP